MAISPNFTASVTYSTQGVLNIVDTSTGSDSAISSRRVTLQLDDGTYLTTSGTTSNIVLARFAWSYSVSFIDLNVLDRDYAINITVEWLNSSNVVLYTKALVFDFTTYSNFGNLQVLKTLASNPPLIDDPNFFLSKIKLTVGIDDANNAISLGTDIGSSQAALDRCKFLLDKKLLFF